MKTQPFSYFGILLVVVEGRDVVEVIDGVLDVLLLAPPRWERNYKDYNFETFSTFEKKNDFMN